MGAAEWLPLTSLRAHTLTAVTELGCCWGPGVVPCTVVSHLQPVGHCARGAGGSTWGT